MLTIKYARIALALQFVNYRIPLNKLTSSKSLREYDPAGKPGVSPVGVPLSVGLVICAFTEAGANTIVKIAANDSPNMTEDIRPVSG